MAIRKAVSYTIVCDECEDVEEFHYGQEAARESGGRATRWVRQQASRAGWTAFSDRDLCPRHSGKAKR